MPLSQVEICNVALGYIGQSTQIEVLATDRTVEADTCLLHYGPALEGLLRGHAWRWATRSTALAVVATAPSDAWGYSYRTPTDCLRPLRVQLAGDPLASAPFAVGGDVTGGLIYTSEAPATLDYVANLATPADYPPDFADALAWELAKRISFPLSKAREVRADATAGAIRARMAAITADANAEHPQEQAPGEFLTMYETPTDGDA